MSYLINTNYTSGSMIIWSNYFPFNTQWQIGLFFVIILLLLFIIVLLINRRFLKKSEKIFRENEEKYKIISSSAIDAIIMTDETGSICFWNEAAEHIFGYAADETNGKALNKYIISPPANSNSDIIANNENKTSISNSLEFSALKKDGTVFPIELTFSSVAMKNKIYSTIIIRDITRRKAMEAHAKKMEESLQQAQKMEAIGLLASGIAHDFNNMLTPIIGYSELMHLQMDKEDPSRENIQEIINSALRAKELIRQILIYSKKSELNLIPVKIQSVIKEGVKLIKSTLPSTIEIKLKIDENCPEIMADESQIHQIIMNLATNAFQAMGYNHGILEIELKEETIENPESVLKEIKPEKYVCLSVSDTGVGISDDIMGSIFDPYFTTKEIGTGLGLSLVHGIVTKFGGFIKVDSKVREGSVFKLYFPCLEHDDMEYQEKVQQEAIHGNKCILLVDDEFEVLKIINQTLEYLGYNVVYKNDSIEALNEFTNHPDKYDLVITDMTMPNMNGRELAVELLKIKPNVPVIIITGYSDELSVKSLKSFGIKNVLYKPILMNDLSVAIRDALRTV